MVCTVHALAALIVLGRTVSTQRHTLATILDKTLVGQLNQKIVCRCKFLLNGCGMCH